MSEKNIIFDEEKINKSSFYRNKKPFIIDNTDVNKILISKTETNSCININEILAQNRGEIGSISGFNWTRTNNLLVCKLTLNYLVKMVKWLSCVVSTYLYGPFDCMFLSCHYRVWINSETRTWHDKNIQSNVWYRQVLTT